MITRTTNPKHKTSLQQTSRCTICFHFTSQQVHVKEPMITRESWCLINTKQNISFSILKIEPSPKNPKARKKNWKKHRILCKRRSTFAWLLELCDGGDDDDSRSIYRILDLGSRFQIEEENRIGGAKTVGDIR